MATAPAAAADQAAPNATEPAPAEPTVDASVDEQTDQSDALVAEVEAEEAVGTEPDGVPPGAAKMFLRRLPIDPELEDPHAAPVEQEVLILWAAPVTFWPMSAFRYLDVGIYYKWADEVLIPQSLDAFNDFDPNPAECKAMVDEWQAAMAVAVGKLQASARSSKSTRRR